VQSRCARRSRCRSTDLPVLAATRSSLAADGEFLGKPADARDAERMLAKLSGTTHRVITGVCLVLAAGRQRRLGSGTTHVTMRELTPDEIRAYVATGESFGKAGAYAIQETGDRFVTCVDAAARTSSPADGTRHGHAAREGLPRRRRDEGTASRRAHARRACRVPGCADSPAAAGARLVAVRCSTGLRKLRRFR